MQALQNCKDNTAPCPTPDMTRWAAMVSGLESQNRLRRIITVNRWFNRLPYKHDEYAYDTLDHWADTAELLQKRGDCEDMALGKYYTLRALGFTPDEMKITVVYDEDTYTNHAVLMVTIDGARFMLDINGDDTDPYEMNTRYRPIYSFNEQKAWFY